MRYSEIDYRNSKTEPLSKGEVHEGVQRTKEPLKDFIKLSQYRIYIDDSFKGTIMESSLGHAAKSALLNLEIKYAHKLRIESERWAELGAICTYYDAFIFRGIMYYENKE